MTSSLVDRCQHFCGTWCLHFQLLAQNRGSTFLKNDGTCLQNYTQSYHKASTSIPTAVRTLNNPLHRVFLSLQDTDYLEHNDKIGTALYITLLSCQYGHNLRAYYKTVLKINTNVRTLVQNALTMPQWLSLGVEAANNKWTIGNMTAVRVTGQYVFQVHVVPRHANCIQGSASIQLIRRIKQQSNMFRSVCPIRFPLI
jgi:hypothetical protein